MEILKKRITKEYSDLSTHQVENNIEVWLVNNDIKHWKAKIKGPVNLILLIILTQD
jgi:ubiquitin-protein ligase